MVDSVPHSAVQNMANAEHGKCRIWQVVYQILDLILTSTKRMSHNDSLWNLRILESINLEHRYSNTSLPPTQYPNQFCSWTFRIDSNTINLRNNLLMVLEELDKKNVSRVVNNHSPDTTTSCMSLLLVAGANLYNAHLLCTPGFQTIALCNIPSKNNATSPAFIASCTMYSWCSNPSTTPLVVLKFDLWLRKTSCLWDCDPPTDNIDSFVVLTIMIWWGSGCDFDQGLDRGVKCSTNIVDYVQFVVVAAAAYDRAYLLWSADI